jgi:hypothetical protein
MTNTQHSPITRRLPKRRPSVALVLAFVALLAALSNGAYAVSTAQKNSVNSKSIKNLSVKTADLATGSVKTAKLANGSVTVAKLKDRAVNSAKIADGSIKAVDLAPGVIPSGNNPGPGPAPSLTVTTVSADSPATGDADGVNNGSLHGIAQATATCPAGTLAIGGGAAWVTGQVFESDDKNNYLKSSYRTSNGWHAKGIVDMGAQGTVKLRVYAYCV